jgi:hypothetical protein
VPKADVVAILKSGAYQDAKLDAADGNHKCQPTEQCIKIFAGAPNHEATAVKYSGAAGAFTVTMKPNVAKDSVVLRGRSLVPALAGELGPGMDLRTKKMHMYGWKLALLDNNRPVQPAIVNLNRPIDGQSGNGQKFKIWVIDLTPQVAVAEFTHPQ